MIRQNNKHRLGKLQITLIKEYWKYNTKSE